MRISIAAAATCLSIIGMTATAQVHAAVRKHTEIPPEPLDLALHELAKERGFQLVYLTENVAALQTRGAIGDFTVDEALKKLLSDSRLEYKFVDDNTVSIFPKTTPTSALGADRTRTSGSDQNASGSASKRSTGEQFRLAQVDQGSSSGTASLAGKTSSFREDTNGSPGLSEIVVTAQKKSERLQDVPVPVSVINADTLADYNQVRLRDYYSSVPGLSIAPDIEGTQQLAIRGITTGSSTAPTVGITVDDIPFAASTSGNGSDVPDFDPGDLARIEVLRGPQGTLYGAESMGGLIRYVTKDPSTEEFSGRVEAGGNHVTNGPDLGYSVRGSVNVPVSSSFAFRASAFFRQDAGYISNPVLDERGVNKGQAEGGRLAALWKPSDDFSIKLTGLYQHAVADGLSEVRGGAPGALSQDYIGGLGGPTQILQAYGATVNWQVGDVHLTSVSGYNILNNSAPFDFTFDFGPITSGGYPAIGFAGFGPGITGTPLYTLDTLHKFSEELRASGTLWENVEWLAGAFYTNELSHSDQNLYGTDPVTGQVYGQTLDLHYHKHFDEYAGFIDATYHFTNQFDVQIGGRESHTSITRDESSVGPFSPLVVENPSPYVFPTQNATSSAFTYLVTPRYKFTPDVMVYARFASGYRPGDTNPAGPGIPAQAKSDKTMNYEGGIKADFLDHRLSVDASIFYIDWKDIQLTVINSTSAFQYVTNGSGARSDGVELSVTLKPLTGLTIAGWIDYDDAVLTQKSPAGSTVFGLAGDRLPYSSRWSANLSVQQDFALWQGATGFAGADANFVGDRLSVFTRSAARQDLPSYTKLDVRSGVNWDSWTASVYANNIADQRGLLNGGVGYIQANAFVYIMPRTIGINLSKRF